MLLALTSCQTGEALSSAVPVSASTQVAQASAPVLEPMPTNPPISAPNLNLAMTEVETETGIKAKAETGVEAATKEYAEVEVLPPHPRTQKTYLINGLMSAIPFIGYGFRNLHKKMPEAQLFSYLSPVESAGVIMPKVMNELEAAYAQDPNVSINLIGISLGADFVSIVAEKLHKKGIPVNYLGIVDGTSLRPIQSNVKKADNLTCTFIDCVKGRVRLAPGNSTTILFKKKYKSSHIPLGDNADLHAHVIEQSRS